MPTIEPHRQRHVAESFGEDPQRYDRTRPRYPEQLIRDVVAAGPGPEVLDVGCGTGISSRAFRDAGCHVTGVEPDERMAAFARRDGFPVTTSTFEEWDPAGRTVDAVVAGQTWHWVDPARGAAQARRVLRPGGILAVFWNGGQPAQEAAAGFAEVYARVLPDLPNLGRLTATDTYGQMAAAAVEGMRGHFPEPTTRWYAWEQRYTTAQWLDLVPTQGLHTRLPAATREDLLDGLGAVVDGLGGSFTMGYATVLVLASA